MQGEPGVLDPRRQLEDGGGDRGDGDGGRHRRHGGGVWVARLPSHPYRSDWVRDCGGQGIAVASAPWSAARSAARRVSAEAEKRLRTALAERPGRCGRPAARSRPPHLGEDRRVLLHRPHVALLRRLGDSRSTDVISPSSPFFMVQVPVAHGVVGAVHQLLRDPAHFVPSFAWSMISSSSPATMPASPTWQSALALRLRLRRPGRRSARPCGRPTPRPPAPPPGSTSTVAAPRRCTRKASAPRECRAASRRRRPSSGERRDCSAVKRSASISLAWRNSRSELRRRSEGVQSPP